MAARQALAVYSGTRRLVRHDHHGGMMKAILGQGPRAGVIVPLMARDLEHLRELLERIGELAWPVDAVEWRIDAMRTLAGREIEVVCAGFELIKQGFAGTSIATYRTVDEGGRGQRDCSSAVLRAAVASGCDLVDVEWLDPQREQLTQALRQNASGRDFGVVFSYHNFRCGCDQVLELYRRMAGAARAGDLVKIAVTVSNDEQLHQLIAQSSQVCQIGSTAAHLIIGMGQAGQPTRVFPRLTGSAATFAALTEEEASAPGQVCVTTLLEFDAATHSLALGR